jgi:hypothetical protein
MNRPHMLDTSDLTAVADGSLGDPRIERLLAQAPALRAELERQRWAVTALRSVELRASTTLRARIESERERLLRV